MSDSEEFEYEEDEDYDLSEHEDDEAIQIENTFYEADDCKKSDPRKALEQFQRVVTLENERQRNGETVYHYFNYF